MTEAKMTKADAMRVLDLLAAQPICDSGLVELEERIDAMRLALSRLGDHRAALARDFDLDGLTRQLWRSQANMLGATSKLRVLETAARTALKGDDK